MALIDLLLVPRRHPRGGLLARVRTRTCACGHRRELHRHYRPGTDCATCGCARYGLLRRS